MILKDYKKKSSLLSGSWNLIALNKDYEKKEVIGEKKATSHD